jgi:prophage regulatory protein
MRRQLPSCEVAPAALQPPTTPAPLRMLDFSELKPKKGITFTRRHIRRKCLEKTFPMPIQIGDRAIAFIESEIDDWIRARMAERDAECARRPLLPEEEAGAGERPRRDEDAAEVEERPKARKADRGRSRSPPEREAGEGDEA